MARSDDYLRELGLELVSGVGRLGPRLLPSSRAAPAPPSLPQEQEEAAERRVPFPASASGPLGVGGVGGARRREHPVWR